jgi:hypothetical protein
MEKEWRKKEAYLYYLGDGSCGVMSKSHKNDVFRNVSYR